MDDDLSDDGAEAVSAAGTYQCVVKARRNTPSCKRLSHGHSPALEVAEASCPTP